MGGFSGNLTGFGGVHSDSRSGAKIDRKAFPRFARVTEVTDEEITEDEHGNHAGRWAWAYHPNDWWHHIRDVMPAVRLEQKPDDDNDGGAQQKPAWRAMWDAAVVDVDLKKRPQDDFAEAGTGQDGAIIGKIPSGWPGLVVRGSDHVGDARPIYFAAGYPVVADHLNGGEFSSYRYAAHEQRIDTDLRGAEHTTTWVKYLPAGGCVGLDGKPAVAWVCGPSGPGGNGYGLFTCDRTGDPTKKLAPPAYWMESPEQTAEDREPKELVQQESQAVDYPKNMLGMFYHGVGGALNAAQEGDQHEIGRNRFGEPLMPAHYAISLIRNIPGILTHDAPAEHELALWEPAGDAGYWHHVHMRWDPASRHTQCGETKVGLWRREVKVPFSPPTYTPPPTKIPPETPPGKPPVETPPTGGPPVENPPTNEPPNTPFRPIRIDTGLPTGGGVPIQRLTPNGAVITGSVDETGQLPTDTDAETAYQIAAYFARAATTKIGPVTNTWMGAGAPAVLFTPDPEMGREVLTPGINDAFDAQQAAYRPFVLRVSGFGRVGTGKAGYDNTTPAGVTYLANPTGPGGVIVSPPEYTPRRSGDYNRSSSRWGWHPEIEVGFGTPLNGELVDGWRWSASGASGSRDAVVKFYDSAGVARSGKLTIGEVSTPADLDVTGKLTVGGLIDPTGIKFSEQAADPGSTGAGEGTVWVRNNTPAVLVYTDDAGNDRVIAGQPDPNTETIATGVITIPAQCGPQTMLAVATESAAPSDDLDAINGGFVGQILVLRAKTTGQIVVAKDGTGNLILAGDCSLDHEHDTLTLMRHSTAWYELARSNNG